MCPNDNLVGLEGPGCEVSHHSHSLGVSSQWAKWAPGLIEALSAMIRRHFKCVHGIVRPHKLASVSADFIRHVQRGHMPFCRDCQVCLQGAAQVRAHCKVLHPDSWTLSMDLSGPFAASQDEFCEVRCMLVGVLTVPTLEKKPRPDDKVSSEKADRAPDLADAVVAEAEVIDPGVEASPVIEAEEGLLVQQAEHHADVDSDQAMDEALGAVDDEFLAVESEEEAEEPIPVGEDHKVAARSWLDVLQADRDSYQKEAADCLLHRVQVMEIPCVENLPIRLSPQ